MWLCLALLASATAWTTGAPPRLRCPTKLREGVFPEPDFARGRQSLRGLWRLQRTCEDEGDCQDIVVNLKASGTFTAACHGDDEAMKVFAAKLNGRWYCDGDDEELRLVRFERQSPVEWYTGLPTDPKLTLSHYAGHVTLGASESEWIGRFTLAPLWPETHAWLSSPPLAAPNFRADAVAGPHYLVWTTEDGAVMYDVDLKADLTWESSGGYDGSSARREAGVAVARSIADTRSALDAVASLERSASRESRADREWLTRAASEAKPLPPERPARLAGTWNVYEGDFDLFRGVGGEGREIFLWCRRTGSREETTSSGVTIDSDLLFIGILEEDDDDVEIACASGIVCVGWTTEPCIVGRFELRRKS